MTPDQPDVDPADLFRPFADCRKVLLAISGGPDSMALLHLARDWSSKKGPRLEAATVDHRLRPEGTTESVQVALWCGALGVAHHALVWDSGRPSTRIQERARTARYELLFALARDIGADAVLTAHHADDQAETVLFRLLRGSGIAGLAGMAAVTWRDGLRLGRPLLSLSKQDLVNLCRDRGQVFFDDPSNTDQKYARVRMRRLLALLAQEGFEPADLARLAARAARAELALAATAERLFARLAPVRQGSEFRCDLSELRGEPEEFLLRLLMDETGRMGGNTIRLDRAERLAGRLHGALRDGKVIKATLGGAIIALSAGGMLAILPEPPRARGRKPSNLVHATV